MPDLYVSCFFIYSRTFIFKFLIVFNYKWFCKFNMEDSLNLAYKHENLCSKYLFGVSICHVAIYGHWFYWDISSKYWKVRQHFRLEYFVFIGTICGTAEILLGCIIYKISFFLGEYSFSYYISWIFFCQIKFRLQIYNKTIILYLLGLSKFLPQNNKKALENIFLERGWAKWKQLHGYQ